MRDYACAWREYDIVATMCARLGIKGQLGDRLPDGIGTDTMQLIDDNPEAFERRVRDCAYERACLATELRNRRESE